MISTQKIRKQREVSSPDLDEKIAQKTRQARIIQLVVIGLVAALFYLREPKDAYAAYAALYGGFVSLFLIWSLTWASRFCLHDCSDQPL